MVLVCPASALEWPLLCAPVDGAQEEAQGVEEGDLAPEVGGRDAHARDRQPHAQGPGHGRRQLACAQGLALTGVRQRAPQGSDRGPLGRNVQVLPVERQPEGGSRGITSLISLHATTGARTGCCWSGEGRAESRSITSNTGGGSHMASAAMQALRRRGAPSVGGMRAAKGF